MKIVLDHVLKREFKARRLTVNGVAKSCSIPISVLHSWVNGALPAGRNLVHIATLANFLEMSIGALLFDQSDTATIRSILFDSLFNDGDSQYRLTVTKLEKEK